MTKSEQMNVLKKDITRKVGQLGMGIAEPKTGRMTIRVAKYFHADPQARVRVGGKATEDTTVADLLAKTRWLDGELVKLTANNIDEDRLMPETAPVSQAKINGMAASNMYRMLGPTKLFSCLRCFQCLLLKKVGRPLIHRARNRNDSGC